MTTTTARPKTAPRTIEDAAAQAKDQLESIVKAQQEQAQKHIEQTIAVTKEQVEKASAQMMKGFDDLSAFNKENVDAFIQSSTIAVKGAETIGKEVAAFAQSSFDKSVAAGKALMTAKTINEVVELQTSFARQAFDAFVAESTRLTELTVKVGNEAVAPLNARFNATVDKLSKPLAA